MFRRVAPWIVVALLALLTSSARAQLPLTGPTVDPAVKTTLQSVVAAFNERDAAKFAKLWSPTGVYHHPETNQRIAGREAIEASFKQSFADNKDRKLAAVVEEVRLVTPDVAIVEGISTASSASEDPIEADFTIVLLKKDGQWLLESIRESDRPAGTTPYDRLKELEWLVGNWADDARDATVETKGAWTANRSFITRSYRVVVKDQVDLEGTQIIGWDPLANQIRSWVFDSDGGYGEGTWSREGDRWSIKIKGVFADGRRWNSTQILQKVDNDTYTTKMSAREVDGEILPNIDEVKVVRQKPAAK